MSYIDSLKNLKEKIFGKSMICFSGNVDDFVISNYLKKSSNEYFKDLEEDLYFSFSEYLIYLLSKEKFQTIRYFTPSSNIIDVEPFRFIEDKKLNLKKMPSQFYPTIGVEEFIDQIIKEIAEIFKNSNPINVKKAYIIDFMDVLNNQNSIAEFPYSNIAKLLSAFNSFYNFDPDTYIGRNIKIILIARNPESINHYLTNKNIELKNSIILKPNTDERKEFIKDFSSRFQLDYSIDPSNGTQINGIVSLTSNLNFRELFQLIRLSKNIENIPDFKSLYNIYMFDKKDSEWERFDKNKIEKIENFLKLKVKGQDDAIKKVKKTIIRSYVGLSGISQSINSKKPKGILFFAGPTGVGKTELAKALTEFVFEDERKLIRFDMSEYSLEHSDQRLIGSPPGYVGHDSGGQLTNAVKENPFSILLFDEIEKAHDKILDKFLQILEDGRLTSSKGELIDFSETFIIFTSNIGSDIAIKKINSSKDEVKNAFIESVKNHFYKIGRPEIYNRIGEKNIVPFDFIDNQDIASEIIKYKYENLCEQIYKKRNILIKPDDENSLKNLSLKIFNKYDKTLGGRGLVSVFETIFIDELSEFIFKKIDLSTDESKNIIRINWSCDNSPLVNDVKFSILNQ